MNLDEAREFAKILSEIIQDYYQQDVFTTDWNDALEKCIKGMKEEKNESKRSKEN